MADNAGPGTIPNRPLRPNGQPLIRRSRPADPLVRPKKRLPKKPTPTGTTTSVKKEEQKPVKVEDDDPSTYTEYKLVTTKAALLANMRFHCMKFHSNRDVNLLNSEEFTQPVRLHRRNPRAPLQGAGTMQAGRAESPKDPDEKEIDPVEKAKQEAAQAEKEAIQKENLAKIAPHGGAVKQKKNMFKKKTQQVFQTDENERKLRYEEYLPWMIEDFDNKNTWVGSLEGALSTSHVMLVMDEGMFKMIPVEKFYRFQQTNLYKTLSAEQAEAAIKKHERLARWFMDVTKMDEKQAKAKEEAENLRATKRLFTVKGDRLEGREGKAGFTDADELDFEEDFADDEEAPIIDGDEEELKEATKKMKREQLGANIFDIRNEKDYEKEELERRRVESQRKAHGKKVKKALKSREKNYAYDDTDTDHNPYASSSESVDTDAEEAAKKEEEEKRKLAEKLAKEKEEEKRKEKEQEQEMIRETKESLKSLKQAASSGASTPLPQSGTSSTVKSPGDNKSKSVKRSGSPGIDSGNESSHQQKRLKKDQQQANGLKSASSALGDDHDRVTLRLTQSPHSASKPKSNTKKRPAPGSGSDVDTGAEMSDAGSGTEKGTKKLKLRVGGAQRANSPPTQTAVKPKSGSPSAKTSRAGSPVAPEVAPITENEIKAAITPEGISSSALIAKFRTRIRSQNKSDFFATLKRVTIWKEVPGQGKFFYPNPAV